MIIARILSEVVATHKHPSHEGRKLLLVQPLDLEGGERGEPLIAADSVDAGVGDRVLVVQEGFSAASAVERSGAPIDAAVIGVIDTIHLDRA